VPSMVEAAELARVNRGDLMGRLGRVFGRREPRVQAGKYVEGLMSDVPRKNGWSLAERAGDRTPDKTQRLLNHAVWDEHRAMDIVRDFVVEHLADPDAVAVLNETGQQTPLSAEYVPFCRHQKAAEDMPPGGAPRTARSPASVAGSPPRGWGSPDAGTSQRHFTP